MASAKTLIIAGILMLNGFVGHAQLNNPVEGTVFHNESLRPCIVVNLESEAIPLKNAWAKFLKKEYDVKLKGVGWFSNKDLLYAEKIVISSLSTKELDFYTQILETETGAEMKVFVSFGYDIYVNPESFPSEYAKMKQMLNAFLRQYLPKYYEDEIERSAKRVKVLKKDISSLEKRIANNKKDIAGHQEKVEELSQNVDESSVELNIAKQDLKNREEKLSSVRLKLETL